MWVFKFEEFYIPEHMVNALKRYVNEHIETGGFLQKVLENDLVGAAGKADVANLRNLPAYAAYLYNEMPAKCWGSKKAVSDWLYKGGAKC